MARGRRDVTNVPTQALSLLNDPFVLQQAGVWAERAIESPEGTVNARLEQMFLASLGRPPTSRETEDFGGLVARLAELHGVPSARVLSDRTIWRDVAHVIFNLKEFIYIP